MVTCSSEIEIRDPDFRRIAKAIHEYLRHEYAQAISGEITDHPPLRVSAYSAKGVGHYQTSPDGRADWSPEFERYIARGEAQEKRVGLLSFGFGEVQDALKELSQTHPPWHRALMVIDVKGMRVEEYAQRANMDLSTAKRHRKAGAFELYRSMRMNDAYARPDNIDVDTIEVP